jgi:hypothetical protein
MPVLSEIPALDPNEIYRQVSQSGETWADQKAAYEALSDNTKSVLAEITGHYMADGKESKTSAEMRALASKDYREHLASVAKARSAFLRAQVAYDSIKMLAELRRTQESTRRAEMRL